MKYDIYRMKGISSRAAQYLYAIRVLSDLNPAVRQVDVSRYLGVKASSCFSAVLGLIRKGLVIETEKKHLTLSETARVFTDRLTKNDSLLVDFFVTVLGMDAAQAHADAQRMEYCVSQELSLHLCKFLHFWKENSSVVAMKDQLERFKRCPEQHENCHTCPFFGACKDFHAKPADDTAELSA